jgi:hypothetical protein
VAAAAAAAVAAGAAPSAEHQQVALRANSANLHKHAQTLRKRFRVCALYAQTRTNLRKPAQT